MGGTTKTTTAAEIVVSMKSGLGDRNNHELGNLLSDPIRSQ